MVTSLPTDQEAPGSIPGSIVGLLSNGGLFHCMYGIGISMFSCPFPYSVFIVLEGGPTGLGRPYNCVLYVIYRKNPNIGIGSL